MNTQSLAVGCCLTTNGQHEGRFHGDESVLHLYCGRGYMTLYLSKFIELYTERSKFYGIQIKKQVKFIALYTNEGTRRLNRFSKLISSRDRIHFTPPNSALLTY